MTAALVLAAGASTRLGRPKQLVRMGGETLLDRAVRVAGEAGLEPVVVVLGASAQGITQECDLRRAWVVVHAGWAEGMGSSTRAGMELVQGFPEVDGAVVMTCDMPGVTAEHLRELAGDPEEVMASGYAGRRGVPAYFPRVAFSELLDLRGDAGAREMLRAARVVELVGGEMDVDTVADVERLQAGFGGVVLE
jgi:molybdenum cofactor cytidylyltransferase